MNIKLNETDKTQISTSKLTKETKVLIFLSFAAIILYITYLIL